jgi:hypothetical protein
MNICRLRGPMALIIRSWNAYSASRRSGRRGECALESRNEGDNTEPLTAIEAQRSTAGSLHLDSTTELPVDSSASSLTELGL